MDAIRILALIANIILTGCQTVGYACFAAAVNNQLHPYFNANGMATDAANADQAFGYLVTSAVLFGILFTMLVLRLLDGNSSQRPSDGNDKSSDTTIMGIVLNLIALAAGVTVLVFACLTAVHTWGWWRYFSAQGIDHLANACCGLAGMIITSLLMTGFSLACLVTLYHTRIGAKRLLANLCGHSWRLG
ncbi:hypothetical protein M426DRAFT_258214 [Hypoxylon sp. CI-4A]|nr:hypothetical protein M426DRAFT_258214 [Hypoxylon sp. CI-4A]